MEEEEEELVWRSGSESGGESGGERGLMSRGWWRKGSRSSQVGRSIDRGLVSSVQ